MAIQFKNIKKIKKKALNIYIFDKYIKINNI